MMINLLSFWVNFLRKLVLLPATLLHMCLLVLHRPYLDVTLWKSATKKSFFKESPIYLITRRGQLCTNFIILSYLRLKTDTEWARWKLFITLPVYIGNTLNGILMSPEVIFRAKFWLSLSQVYWVTLCGHRASFSSAMLHLSMHKCKMQWGKPSPTKVNNHIIRTRFHSKQIPETWSIFRLPRRARRESTALQPPWGLCTSCVCSQHLMLSGQIEYF